MVFLEGGGNMADHLFSILIRFFKDVVTRPVLELRKIYSHENWSEFHQNLIGLIRKLPPQSYLPRTASTKVPKILPLCHLVYTIKYQIIEIKLISQMK